MTTTALPLAAAAVPGPPAWLDREAYPFTPRRLRLPEGTLSYVDEGEGPPILFVHGTPTWSFEYRHLIRALARTHRCVAVDLLGFGLSERPPGFAYTPEAHAAVLAGFVARLGLEGFTLVAHDFGGPIALPLALERPGRVKALVLLNTWMWSIADDPDMRRKAGIAGGALGRFLYRRFNFSLRVLTPYAYGDRRRLTRAIHRQYLAPFPDADGRGRVLWPLARALLASGDFYNSLWQRRDRLAGLPALILWGMRDRAFAPALLARWRSALPQARVVELAGAGHWPHEEAPDDVVEALRAFLAHTSAPPATASGSTLGRREL
jgi:haloalkane dehalogenase